MSGTLLSPEDRAHLLGMLRRQTPSPVHRRMNALLLLDDGRTAERVAEVLFIDAETVREHRRLYQASGVTGIGRLNYEGADAALDTEQLAAGQSHFRTVRGAGRDIARLGEYRDEILSLITDKFHFMGKFNPQAP